MASTNTNPTHTPQDPAALSGRALELAKDTGATLASQANDAGSRGMSAIGQVVHSAASKVEHAGSDIAQRPGNPVEREHVEAISGSLHRAGDYLAEGDPARVVKDIDRSVHRHPYRAMAAGVAAGWIIGRFISGRN